MDTITTEVRISGCSPPVMVTEFVVNKVCFQ